MGGGICGQVHSRNALMALPPSEGRLSVPLRHAEEHHYSWTPLSGQSSDRLSVPLWQTEEHDHDRRPQLTQSHDCLSAPSREEGFKGR